MSDIPVTRRNFVGAMATGLAATWIAGAWRAPMALAAGTGTPAAGPTLTPAQLRDLDAVSALIIPTDDAPGAREAHVVDFIDRGLGTFAADQRPLFEQGLADLAVRAARRHADAKAFADLDADNQIALLHELEAEHSEFFEAVRVSTITGFLADPKYGGNTDKVGWKLIGFEDRFAWQPPFGWYDRDASRSE
ncbi:MAG TPA: gluconate 2-dehydrogenase subunit 3 family protein [Gemmatimonadales bacterium]|nr:gluconate 2-dehydrogenase subunit 3 family protein [Gemmatimonadales bacterium]